MLKIANMLKMQNTKNTKYWEIGKRDIENDVTRQILNFYPFKS